MRPFGGIWNSGWFSGPRGRGRGGALRSAVSLPVILACSASCRTGSDVCAISLVFFPFWVSLSLSEKLSISGDPSYLPFSFLSLPLLPSSPPILEVPILPIPPALSFPLVSLTGGPSRCFQGHCFSRCVLLFFFFSLLCVCL